MTTPALATDQAAIGRDVRRSMRARRWGAFQLALPLLITLLIAFVAPIALLFHKAIDNEEPGRVLSRTMAAMPEWVTGDLPPEPLYAALAADLAQAHQEKSAALLGKRLNYELSGARSVIVSTARKAGALEPIGVKEQLIAHDPLWGSPEMWQILRRNAAPLTAHFLLSAVDMRQSATDGLERVPEDQRVFLAILGRTLLIAAMVTVLTLLLGFPVAYVISIAPARVAAIMLLLVLLPLWTSLLVRTTAWVVLLQTEGVINDTLMALGLTAERLQLIFSRIGTVTAMTHIQLPFTILPIYSVMKSIPPTQMRAARSLGAGPFRSFWHIYAPQTLPGVMAGCIITFILSLGYYITPELVGGPNDQMMSNFISLYINRELNWGLAGALGVVLLMVTIGIYLVFLRLVGAENLRFG